MAVLARRFSSLTRLSLVLGMLAVAAVVTPAGSAGLRTSSSARDTVLPTLYVAYGMSCTFSITDDAGKKVTSIAPGTYQVQVTSPVVFSFVDLSGINDMTACKGSALFQLTGPGVNLSTTLQDGDEDKEVLNGTFLASSTYTAQDNNQPAASRVVFSTTATGSAGAVSIPTSSSSSGKGTASTSIVGSGSTKTKSSATVTSPLRGTLTGAVNAAGKLTLTWKGKGVATLKHGRYTFSVTDQAAKSSFTVQELRKQATTITGTSFVGRKTVTLDLKVGQWMAYSGVGKKFYFIVVA